MPPWASQEKNREIPRAGQGAALPPSLPSFLVAPGTGGCPCRLSPGKHIGVWPRPMLGWRWIKLGQQGPGTGRGDPFSAPASLMSAGMSLGKLRTTELDLPTATHPLPWQRKWSLLQPTASSPKHTSPGEQLGLPSISEVPGFSKYGTAEALLGESYSSVPPAWGISWSLMHLLPPTSLSCPPSCGSCHAMQPRLARLWTNHPEPVRPRDRAYNSAKSVAHSQSFLSGACKTRHWDPSHSPAGRQPGRRPQGSLAGCAVCAVMAGLSTGNGSASSPSLLLLLLDGLACLGLCIQGWQLGDIH